MTVSHVAGQNKSDKVTQSFCCCLPPRNAVWTVFWIWCKLACETESSFFSFLSLARNTVFAGQAPEQVWPGESWSEQEIFLYQLQKHGCLGLLPCPQGTLHTRYRFSSCLILSVNFVKNRKSWSWCCQLVFIIFVECFKLYSNYDYEVFWGIFTFGRKMSLQFAKRTHGYWFAFFMKLHENWSIDFVYCGVMVLFLGDFFFLFFPPIF